MSTVKIKQRMYAILTTDATAMAESALCSRCYPDPEKRRRREAAAEQSGEMGSDIGIGVQAIWEDCTDNDALECQECGSRSA